MHFKCTGLLLQVLEHGIGINGFFLVEGPMQIKQIADSLVSFLRQGFVFEIWLGSGSGSGSGSRLHCKLSTPGQSWRQELV
mmetsp:Transcript_4478/g.6011  ORF Transcript_4478/g.6011 Transcript_4478/m.6011 type:complete len:81 (+) Transcript_4478:2243-2485(+)